MLPSAVFRSRRYGRTRIQPARQPYLYSDRAGLTPILGSFLEITVCICKPGLIRKAATSKSMCPFFKAARFQQMRNRSISKPGMHKAQDPLLSLLMATAFRPLGFPPGKARLDSRTLCMARTSQRMEVKWGNSNLRTQSVVRVWVESNWMTSAFPQTPCLSQARWRSSSWAEWRWPRAAGGQDVHEDRKNICSTLRLSRCIASCGLL